MYDACIIIFYYAHGILYLLKYSYRYSIALLYPYSKKKICMQDAIANNEKKKSVWAC